MIHLDYWEAFIKVWKSAVTLVTLIAIYLLIWWFMIYYILLGRILQLPRGKGHKRTSRSYSKVPHLTHPPIRIRKTATAPGSPYSFRIVRGFFYVPQNYQHSRNFETGPPTYRPYPRRLESLTICRWYYKGSTFSSVIFKTLSVGPVGVSNSRPPASRPVHNQVSYRCAVQFFLLLFYC